MCPLSYADVSTLTSTSLTFGSFRCSDTHCVSTRTSGCAYCVADIPLPPNLLEQRVEQATRSSRAAYGQAQEKRALLNPTSPVNNSLLAGRAAGRKCSPAMQDAHDACTSDHCGRVAGASRRAARGARRRAV